MADRELMRDLKRHRPKLRRGKSDLYRWLEENFRQLTAEGYGAPDGASWQELTDRLNRIGKVNKDGRPLGMWGVISIFKRVKRDIEAKERERLLGVSSTKQVRAPRGWTPPIAGKPEPAAGPSPFAPPQANTESSSSDPYSPERLKAGIAEVLAKRSGR